MRQDSKLEIDDGWIYINGEVFQRVNVLFKRRFSPISWEHTSKTSRIEWPKYKVALKVNIFEFLS